MNACLMRADELMDRMAEVWVGFVAGLRTAIVYVSRIFGNVVLEETRGWRYCRVAARRLGAPASDTKMPHDSTTLLLYEEENSGSQAPLSVCSASRYLRCKFPNRPW